ncbi:WYL domain-containing protein [Deinococcus sp. 6GRE01]|uniref:helix-turn-helix transcriptional regulator n=1 Tax=Deinococcus sp. 6GRE01 TaxID=2745873 RepID=UPI001E465A19|nr:WYL domain-containing protein [Deinococcus sp. 6GRE01]
MTVTRRRDQGRRLLGLLRVLLDQEPRTTAELAALLDCQQQDIQRDLRLLAQEGYQRWSTGSRPVRHGLRRPTGTPSTTHAMRAVVTHALLRLLHHHAPTPSRVYADVLADLNEQLPARVQEVSRRALTPPEGDTPRVLDVVAAAWCHGEPLRMRYRKPGDAHASDRVVDILFMEINRSNLDWYVFARPHGETRVKTFHLSRIEDAARVNDQSSPPIDFDPREELDGAWGIIGGRERCEITLRFTPDAAPYVTPHRWPGQVGPVQRHPDGRCTLQVLAPVNQHRLPVEVMAWIRGWGSRVEVVSPTWLREAWLTEAREVLSRYGS